MVHEADQFAIIDTMVFLHTRAALGRGVWVGNHGLRVAETVAEDSRDYSEINFGKRPQNCWLTFPLLLYPVRVSEMLWLDNIGRGQRMVN